MSPRLKLLVALLVVAFARTTSHADGSPRGLDPSVLSNVVWVRSGAATGTGFLLRHGGRRFLVTARHVVDGSLDGNDPVEFRVGGQRGRVIARTRRVADDRRSDLAIFSYTDDPFMPYFGEDAGVTPHEEPPLGSPVYLVGYPASLGHTYQLSDMRVVGGWIAGLRQYVAGTTVEYMDIDMSGVEHGHSGGPIVLPSGGAVAVAVQRRSGSVSNNIAATYAVPVKYVTALIDGRRVEEDTAALNEMMRETTLVFGLSLLGETDYDIWTQCIDLGTGEPVWGDVGIPLTTSELAESRFVTVPSEDGGTLIVHDVALPGNDTDILVQRVSRFGERSSDKLQPVCRTDLVETEFEAVGDGRGGAIVAYELHHDNGNIDVLAQAVKADGTVRWHEVGQPVGTATIKERHPQLVPDGAGGAVVVFEQHLDNGDMDVVAQRIDAAGRLLWHDGEHSAMIANSGLPETSPRSVVDASGSTITAYVARIPDGRRLLLAQRLSPHGEMQWQNGERGVFLLPAALDGDDEPFDMIPDGLGGAFVAASVRLEQSGPRDTDIMLQRIARDGTLLWGDGILLGTDKPEREPVLIADAQGGVIVAYEIESSASDIDLAAQRVDQDGRLRWNEGRSGSFIASSLLSEQHPRIVRRHEDRILVLFEIASASGRTAIACQSISIGSGRRLFNEGRSSVLLMSAGGGEIDFLLARATPGGPWN